MRREDWWRRFACMLAMVLWPTMQPSWADPSVTSPSDIAALFVREVNVRLNVPSDERSEYARNLNEALAHAGLNNLAPQYFVLVDRSAVVQAAFIYWRSPNGDWHFIDHRLARRRTIKSQNAVHLILRESFAINLKVNVFYFHQGKFIVHRRA